ncbi:DUF418 domain-containing protein [Paraglaciecola sp.]|uniref:DUF418 domain-containing protein n=1 Tax=Paraglaciecola sp. TaxID=1920173 RepID=UPI003EF53665
MKIDSRIHAVDALRGFALIGILIAHTTGYFLAGPLVQELMPNLLPSTSSFIINQANYWLVMGKFFSIFAFLFGLSFFIQMKSGEEREANFGLRFLWRLVILAGFGLVNAIFFPGDILFIYAIVGMFLLPFWKLSNLTLFITATLLLLGLGRIIPFYFTQGASLFYPNTWADYVHHVDTIINGDFWDTAKAGFGRAADLTDRQINITPGRAYVTLGYFLLGILVGRMGWLEDIQKNKLLILKTFYLSIIASILTISLHFYFIGGAWIIFGQSFNTWSSLLIGTVFDLQAISITFLYISGFVLLFNRLNGLSLFKLLSAYGRTALTSYICQSIIGTFILFNWGLGLITKISMFQCLGIAIGILMFQIAFSYYWLKHFKYGPLEWVWRSLTYMKWVPNKISTTS